MAAVLAWQAYAYSGLFSLLAEWQFRTFDRMFPIATIALVVFVLSLPFIILIGVRLWRRRKAGEPIIRKRLRISDIVVQKTFAALTISAAIVSLVLAVLGLRIGGTGDSEKASGVLEVSDVAIADGSRVRARAWTLTNRVGFYIERFVVTGRELYVVPLASGLEDAGIQVFLEVPRPPSLGEQGWIEEGRIAPERRPERREVTGVVRRAALPGGLERLYQNAGYRIEHPTYVIFKDTPSARWPFFSAAADIAILALLLGICWAAMTWHVRKLKSGKAQGHQST